LAIVIDQARTERTITELFRISVTRKGANALLEIVGGVLALLIPPGAVTTGALCLTQGELREDPCDCSPAFVLVGDDGGSIALGSRHRTKPVSS